jgi:hypothetical protein
MTSRLGTGKPLTFFYSVSWSIFQKTLINARIRAAKKVVNDGFALTMEPNM